jgi:uncharacterized protein (DUF2336 family)
MDISAAFSMSQLAKLAQSKNPKKRDQLFLALGSLCAISKPDENASGAAFGEIMFLLNGEASEETRQQASNLLCEKDWTPRKLVLSWAKDIIPVANPVLLKSPVLTEDDLVQLARDSSLFHRLAIADRPQISTKVTDTLIGFNEPEVLVVMTGNESADMTMETFASCVRISRRHTDLRTNLSQRDDLPRSLIPSLFAYSTPSEREEIASKFGVDADNFSVVVRQAVLAKSEPKNKDGAENKQASEELEVARLVAKLAKSNALTTGYVVKAASTEKTMLFEHSISTLASIPVENFRAAMGRHPSVALALTCQAAGIDRSAYPSLHRSLNESGYFSETLSGETGSKAAKAYAGHSPAAAAVALRLMARNA